jgi:hypothetical protein
MIPDKVGIFQSVIDSPIRTIKSRVRVIKGSYLAYEFTHDSNIQNITIERLGENAKFFGFGVCQKLKLTLVDKDRSIDISKTDELEVEFGVNDGTRDYYVSPYPRFFVTDVKRDENTNAIDIEAYDLLYFTSEHNLSEIDTTAPYTIGELAERCSFYIGVNLKRDMEDSSFDTIYPEGANFEGTETIREALNAIAEATQTIYYISNNWELVFKKLGGDSVLIIDKSKYFSLDSKEEKVLTSIISATELGDNVGTSTGYEGVTQYVRNNPFWELREDVATLVEAALDNIGGLSINQFTCSWRGNFLLEIGDKIDIVTKDNNLISSYILNDTISYNGSLSGKTEWVYEEQTETASNPSTLGEVLKQTFAKVDKQNKEIQLLASESDKNKQELAEIRLSTQDINASVTNVSQSVDELNNSIGTLTERVNAQLTPEAVEIQIQNELANGIDKITTTTGFTFNEEGLNVSKSGSEISTTISEDGMAVAKSGQDVLTANNEGVKAIDLHAETYLIIAGKSRLESYGDRTACFWIGGSI